MGGERMGGRGELAGWEEAPPGGWHFAEAINQ